MTDAPNPPLALTVHDGSGPLPQWRENLVAEWLRANRINPAQVSTNHPIHILPVPAEDQGWLIQIITFHQYYVGPDGERETNFLTRKTATLQRTVPLAVPFPTASPTDGEDRGQADGQAAQEAPEEFVRPSREAQISGGHEGEGPQRPVQGSAERIESNPEEDPGQGHQAVSEPEEDRQEEVEASR